MTDPKQIQQTLFAQIKAQLPGNLSFVDEMAELLQLSPDSAYRRIRGETLLTLDEMMLLCGKYAISMDSLLHINGNSIVFTGQQIDFDSFELEAHLAHILQQLQMLAASPNGRMYYLAKDVPVFHYFQFAELAAFKFFAWLKTLLRHPDNGNKKFILAEAVNEKWQALSQRIWATYAEIAAEEIWSAETINSTIRQIEYCREAMLFDSEETVQLLYGQLLQMLDRIESQAANGHKTLADKRQGGAFQLYYNGALLGDNTILMQLGEGRRVFINHGILNYINTGDENFCNYTFASLQHLIQKSSLLSKVGEKERNKFFNVMRNKIERHK
jgi:hypothetical protein